MGWGAPQPAASQNTRSPVVDDPAGRDIVLENGALALKYPGGSHPLRVRMRDGKVWVGCAALTLEAAAMLEHKLKQLLAFRPS